MSECLPAESPFVQNLIRYQIQHGANPVFMRLRFAGIPPMFRKVTFARLDRSRDPQAFAACGYRIFKGQAIAADRLERLSALAYKLREQAGPGGGFGMTPELTTAAGCAADAVKAILAGIGYDWSDDGAGGIFKRRARKRPKKSSARGNAKAKKRPGGKSNRRRGGKNDGPNPCSPFAILKELTARR